MSEGGGVSAPGGCIPACNGAATLNPRPVDRILDTRFWKYYLVPTSLRAVITGNIKSVTDFPPVPIKSFNMQVMGILPEFGEEASIKWTKLDDNARVLDEISWKVCELKVPQDEVNSKYRMYKLS